MFTFLSFLVFAGALAWSLHALWRPAPAEVHTSTRMNLAVYRDRLEELKQDLATGLIDEEQYQQARAEMARALLQDLRAEEEQQITASRRSRLSASLSAVVAVAALSIGLYSYLSDRIYLTEVPPATNTPEALEIARQVRSQLFLVQQDPGNAENWYLLGNGYIAMGRFDAALQAYERAMELSGESAKLLVSQAHALARLHGGNLEGRPAQLIRHALALEPENPAALTWAGMLGFQSGDFDQAMRYWRALLDQLEPGSDHYRQIEGLIAEAQLRKAGMVPRAPGEPAATPQHPAAVAGLTVQVDLAESVRAQASPGDSVFIFARASAGPRMPLAVVRKTVADLPLTLTLDDSMAMAPQLALSQFDEVMLVARVSKSGGVQAASGDLVGEIGPVSTQLTEPVRLVINKVVP